MSPERKRAVKWSRWCNGEDEKDRRQANPVENGRGLNNHCFGYRHGGVGGRGMGVQIVRLKVENSLGGRKGPTSGTSGQAARRRRSREKSERSIVVKKAVMTLERRDRT
jgi:hypothetical protein